MHDYFADWYRPCTTGTESSLTEDLLLKRWTGVAKLAEATAESVLHLVRLILQKRTVPGDFLGKFKAVFKEADSTFQMSGNDLELSVLAGAVACQAMTEESDEADLIALGLVCATSILPSTPPWAVTFVACANAYLDERLRTVRSAAEVRRPQLAQKKVKPLIDAFVTRLAENAPAPTSEAAKQLMEAVIQALVSTTDATSEAITKLERQSQLRREESDILWWMTAGVSRDMNVPFTDLKTLAASVIAGKELASLVSPPGVLPARTLLQSMIPPPSGKGAKKAIGLIAAVNATDRGWRQSVENSFKIDGSIDLLPALAAVKQSLTTDEPNAWIAGYKKGLGIGGDILLSPADLSHQIYRECLLAKLVMAQ